MIICSRELKLENVHYLLLRSNVRLCSAYLVLLNFINRNAVAVTPGILVTFITVTSEHGILKIFFAAVPSSGDVRFKGTTILLQLH